LGVSGYPKNAILKKAMKPSKTDKVIRGGGRKTMKRESQQEKKKIKK